MFGNMKEMMGKLQDAKAQAQALKTQLEQVELKEEQQGISVIVNGNKKIRHLSIDASLLENAEELERSLLFTLNTALERAEDLHAHEMKKMAQGMVPGLDKFT
jgi:DNA-binding protein YbaB